jgi:hypothetical protein
MKARLLVLALSFGACLTLGQKPIPAASAAVPGPLLSDTILRDAAAGKVRIFLGTCTQSTTPNPTSPWVSQFEVSRWIAGGGELTTSVTGRNFSPNPPRNVFIVAVGPLVSDGTSWMFHDIVDAVEVPEGQGDLLADEHVERLKAFAPH